MRDLVDRYGIWLALSLALAFLAQGWLGSLGKSLTFDEPIYIAAGYTYLTTGEFEMNTSHPPLMQDLAALPLLFMDLKLPGPSDPDWRAVPLPIRRPV